MVYNNCFIAVVRKGSMTKNIGLLFLGLFFISTPVLADEAVQPAVSGQLIMLGGFFVIFYFLVWRPQRSALKRINS